VLERGTDVKARVASDTANGIAHQRLERVQWFREWLGAEIAGLDDPRDAGNADSSDDTDAAGGRATGTR
jgi:uncharacterized protein